MHTPVLRKLAELYSASTAGRHGGGTLDFQPGLETLLKAAACAEGDARELAVRDLFEAQRAGLITLEPIHRRDPAHIGKVRFSPANEAALFAHLGLVSPSARRAEWGALFAEAEGWVVPGRFTEAWQRFCRQRAQAAACWKGMKPFVLEDPDDGRELLALVAQLLAWEGRHLVRWASSVLCGDSKTLERRKGKLEALLAEASGGAAPSFESLGILPVPAEVSFHGPLRLKIGEEWRDFGIYQGPVKLSGVDVERITGCECRAARCLTVENATPFRSLAALGSGELLIHTSYPNRATLGLLAHLRACNPPPEFWHFGDTDPDGFQILADLRERSGISFRAFRMNYRPKADAAPLSARERALVGQLLDRMPAEADALNTMLESGSKGEFEQEDLRPPTSERWPFYGIEPG